MSENFWKDNFHNIYICVFYFLTIVYLLRLKDGYLFDSKGSAFLSGVFDALLKFVALQRVVNKNF